MTESATARFDSSGLEVLCRQECLRLLSTAPIGRIVFTDHALPAIQPVGFALHGGDVIIRTATGAKLSAAVRKAIVAFEADEFDTATRTGWSVTVVGLAQVVTDPAERDELQRLPLLDWAPGRHDDFIRIRPQVVSGRRIQPFRQQKPAM